MRQFRHLQAKLLQKASSFLNEFGIHITNSFFLRDRWHIDSRPPFNHRLAQGIELTESTVDFEGPITVCTSDCIKDIFVKSILDNWVSYADFDLLKKKILNKYTKT